MRSRAGGRSAEPGGAGGHKPVLPGRAAGGLHPGVDRHDADLPVEDGAARRPTRVGEPRHKLANEGALAEAAAEGPEGRPAASVTKVLGEVPDDE